MHTYFWLGVLTTNYDIWLQGRLSSHMLLRTPIMEHRNRRGEQVDRRTTTLHSTLLPPTAIPRSLFTTPFLTSACSHRRDGCTNGKTPIFTLCLFMNGRQHRRGRAKLGNTIRLSCLECKVLLWCPPPNTKPRPKWGSSHSYVELLFDVYKCMTRYLYARLLLLYLYAWL